jgi:hypothetical protein
MTAFTYPVAPLIVSLIALGMIHLFDILTHRISHIRLGSLYLSGIICITAVYALNPVSLLRHRIDDNLQRNAEIHNTIIYKKLNSKLPDGTKIINCKSFEDVEVMFYTNFDAYHWWPEAPVLDSLQDLGYRFAAFRSHTEQHLPDYITQDTSIILLQDELK